MTASEQPQSDRTPPSVGEAVSRKLALRDDLVFQPEIDGTTPSVTIEDPLRGKFFRIGAREYAFLALLDGRTSIAEAVALGARSHGAAALAEHEALALCRWLLDNQLARPAGVSQAERLRQTAVTHQQQKLLAFNPLALQLPLVAPDRVLGTIARHCRWLASWPAATVWGCVVAYAGYLLCVESASAAETAYVILQQDNWIWLAAAWLGLKVLHETAHGIACKLFGGSVPKAGVALIFFAPLAYVDVTSSWRFRSKWQRIATAAAGMYAELFVAAMAVIVASRTEPGWTHSMAVNVAFTASVATVLFNANPLVRFDGYYIVSDLFEVPNLSSRGQQLLTAAMQWCLAGGPWQPTGLGRKAWLVAVYAVAALVWRVVFYVAIAAALVAWFAECGVALAVLVLTFGWGVPTARSAMRLAAAVRQSGVRRRRAAMVGGMAVAMSLALAFLLLRPGRVSAPAVVEYAPLTIVRADAPGFVEELCVTGGQQVSAGQEIARLRNDDLQNDLSDLELQARQSVVKERMHERNDEQSQGQAEAARRQALDKKIAELRKRVDSLTIRAPSAGTIVAKDLESFRGRYLPTGGELVVLGSEERKELVIAAPQDDIDAFQDQWGRAGEIRVRTADGTLLSARLTKVEPRAGIDLPHLALATTVGGSLAVKPRPANDDPEGKSRETVELLTPAFIARAELPAAQSATLMAGQRANVQFSSAVETTAVRLWKSAEAWFVRRSSRERG